MHTLQKVFTIAAITLLAACSSAPQKGGSGTNEPEITTDTAPGVEDTGNGVEVIPANGAQANGGDLNDGQSLDDMKMTDVDSIYEPVIYFDYDQYDLDDKATDIVRYHANILLQNPKEKLILKGNTDERGTPEYNLALGEKRAKAVEQAMMLFGVDKSRIEVISFGEEQPAVSGSNEMAWQKNRRVDIVIK